MGDDPMRIFFVRHSLLNRGGDKMIVAYASALADAGHQVVIKTNLFDSVFDLSPRIKLEPFRFRDKIGTILSLLLDSVNADIVIADIIPLTFFLSLRNKKRVLYFAQDYNENSYSTVIQKLFIRLLYVVSLRLFKVPVVAVSDELAHLLAQRFGADAKVIHNGVDLKTFYYDPSEDLLRQKGDCKVILLFSRRDYRKGFDLALATIKNLVETYLPLIEVWTVGEPLNDNDVPCVHRDFGYVCETKLRRIMSSVDLFLYPSRNEGFPLMVLEAFACKCPVVTTDAIPYAIDGENALVARIEDVNALTAKVEQILMDREFACELADNAVKFVLNYSLQTSAQEFETTLQTLLEK